MNKMILIVFLMLVWPSSVLLAQSKAEKQIRRTMEEQNVAWNAGDINRFMEPYWKSDSLMFIGKSGVTYGWENTLKNYKTGYPDTASMGKLTFTIIQVKRLSSKYYSVVGRWHLARSAGNLGGHFTLIFEKIKGQWVIISDHSS